MRAVVFMLLVLFAARAGAAEKPVLEHLFPAAVARGATNSIALAGKFEPWPPSVSCENTNLSFAFSTNAGTLLVTVPSTAAVGPCWLRLYNDEGSSEPKILVVQPGPLVLEAEPNSHFGSPQAVHPLPATIDGRLDKSGDTDSFAFTIPPGQWLDARLESHTLMSKLDAVLRLVNPQGQQLAWNHDFDTLDPRLVWRAPSGQSVVLQVFGFAYPANAEIQLAGGPGGVYRLHLQVSDRPPEDLSFALTEQEPNQTSQQAQGLSLGSAASGMICPAGDEDRYRITLAKDQFLSAAVEAAALGSPLDAWLKVEDQAGRELLRVDDSEASRDPSFDWAAPADGEYILAVGSLTRQGREDFRYRLTAAAGARSFEARVDAHSFVLQAPATNQAKITVKKLRGFKSPLSISVRGLPAGVASPEISVPAEAAEASVSLIAGPDAQPFHGPVRIWIKESETGAERTVPFEFTTRSVNNGVPGGYSQLLLESTDALWLTVKPKPPEPAPAKAP